MVGKAERNTGPAWTHQGAEAALRGRSLQPDPRSREQSPTGPSGGWVTKGPPLPEWLSPYRRDRAPAAAPEGSFLLPQEPLGQQAPCVGPTRACSRTRAALSFITDLELNHHNF